MPVAVMRSRTEAPSGGACRNADSSAQSGSSPSAESGSARVSLLRLGRGTAGCWSPLRAAPSVAAREWIEALTIEVEALDLGCTGEDVSVVGKWDGGAACCWTTGPGGATDALPHSAWLLPRAAVLRGEKLRGWPAAYASVEELWANTGDSQVARDPQLRHVNATELVSAETIRCRLGHANA